MALVDALRCTHCASRSVPEWQVLSAFHEAGEPRQEVLTAGDLEAGDEGHGGRVREMGRGI
jgi:hypothetical protein